MVDFRVADTAPEHPKLRAAGLPAAGLWAMAGGWSMRELTDGWVPDYWVQSWPGGKAAARKLLDVGLWSRQVRMGIPGYVYHDWLDIQRSAASVHEEREKGRERARRSRERSAERTGATRADVHRESHDSRALTRALTPEGSGRGRTSGTERAQPSNGPRPRCPKHADWPADQQVPSCGACMQLRLEAEQQAADQAEQAADDRARRRALIDACPDCDHNGIRDLGDLGASRCSHPAASSPLLRSIS